MNKNLADYLASFPVGTAQRDDNGWRMERGLDKVHANTVATARKMGFTKGVNGTENSHETPGDMRTMRLWWIRVA